MSKHDLEARRIYHHTRESIEAHVTIVFAAHAVSHRIEHQTGWSIKKFVRTARRHRTVTIQAGRQTLTAAESLPDDLAEALARIHGSDPWQAVYGWRGATPDKVATLLEAGFVDYPLSQSFRFKGHHMPALAQALRDGESVRLPWLDGDDVDVALARQWQHLLPAGRNILPLAFRTISNQTDAALNLFLDVVTRANLSRPSFGREAYLPPVGIGEVMRALGLGEVVASNNPNYAVGQTCRDSSAGRSTRSRRTRCLCFPSTSLRAFRRAPTSALSG